MMKIELGDNTIEMRPIDQVRVSEDDTQDLIQRGLDKMLENGHKEYTITTGDVFVELRIESEDDVCPVIISITLMRPERGAMVSASCDGYFKQLI